MCTKYIVEPCEKTYHCKFKKDKYKLTLQNHHDKYTGDSTWNINTYVDPDGKEYSIIKVMDNHNIEKAVLAFRRANNYACSIPFMAYKVRELLDNPIIPDSLIRSRVKAMKTNGFLTSTGDITELGYDMLITIRDYKYMYHMPTKLKNEIKAIGNMFLRSCKAA